MCEALRELMAEDLKNAEEKGIVKGISQGISEGISQGIAQGVVQGADKHIIEQVCKKIAKGKNVEVIASEIEEETKKSSEDIRYR